MVNLIASLIMSGVNYQPPGMPASWLMVGSTFNDTESISNPNDFVMTVTLANNWVGGTGFSWASPGSYPIQPRSSISVAVHYSGSNTDAKTATSAVSWSVAGGGSGTATANGEHDSGL